MSKAAELTARETEQLIDPGVHRVSKNLYLFIRPPARRSWLLIYRSPVTGRRTEMGLGPVDVLTTPQAKALAQRYRVLIHEGRCPLSERRSLLTKAPKAVTFEEVVGLYITAHQGLWRTTEHRRQWDGSLQNHAKALLDLPVGLIDTGAVLQVLEPMWQTRTVTASRVRGRIEAVLDYAAARSWRTGDNPARWRGHLAKLLPSPKQLQPVKHLPALDWRVLPKFWTELSVCTDQGRGLSALALQLLLLTAVRRGEAIDARWDEVDINEAVWTVPQARMKKGKRDLRVPLSSPAIEVLHTLAALRRDDLLFPGTVPGRPIGGTGLLELLHQLRPGVTVHGFRSGFRTYVSEATHYDPEIAKASLAHTIDDKTDAAYQRGDLFEKRREVLQDWGRYLEGAAGS